MITDVKDEILRSLENASTPEKRAFDKKLIDTEKRIVGVKTAVADGIVAASLKGNYGDPEKLISLLPDDVYETVLIKCGIISGLPVGDEKRKELIDAVLPSVDNWANCDFFVARSKYMRKNHPFWFEYAKGLISSDHDFTVRFAIVSLMSYFLGDDYIDETLGIAANVRGDDYYVGTAVSWLFATALAKIYNKAVRYLETGGIKSAFVHNTAIKKASESFRISPERKTYLKTLKRV